MTRIDSTKTKWRVQIRLTRGGAWRNAGLFETRERAREEALFLRNHTPFKSARPAGGVGFGNTRTVRHISGKGKAS